MWDEKDSCSVRSTGFTLSHLLPRMSTTTVKPRARTSSLMGQAGGGGEDVRRRRSGCKSRTPPGTHLGMVDRYVTNRLRSSCFIRS